jgi:CRISPR system Cascade subunit CasC
MGEDRVDGAFQVTQAFSIDALCIENDFFTATDDLLKGTGSGHVAGHMRNKQLISWTVYQFMILDTNLFLKNLSGNIEKANKYLKVIVEAVLEHFPKSHSVSQPDVGNVLYCMIEKSQNNLTSFSPVLQKPISQYEDAISKFHEFRDRRNTAHNWDDVPSIEWYLSSESCSNTKKELQEFVKIQ